VIDYRTHDIADAVKAATDGRGADAIYDPVGGDAFTSATPASHSKGASSRSASPAAAGARSTLPSSSTGTSPSSA